MSGQDHQGDFITCAGHCRRYERGYCKAAERGMIPGAGRKYQPTTPDDLQRCVGFAPRMSLADTRTAEQRWPWMFRIEEAAAV